MRRSSGANSRNRNRGGAPALQPNGGRFADGRPTDSFTTSAWDSNPEAFRDRWERIGSNSVNDLYAGTLNWVVTPKYHVEVLSGYWWYDTTTPQEFAGAQLIHSFSSSNINVFPEIPASLQNPNGYSDNKSTSRTAKDRFDRAYVNANNTFYKTMKGEHIIKAGARFERLGNDVNSGNQQPTISLFWNQGRSTTDDRSVRGLACFAAPLARLRRAEALAFDRRRN